MRIWVTLQLISCLLSPLCVDLSGDTCGASLWEGPCCICSIQKVVL